MSEEEKTYSWLDAYINVVESHKEVSADIKEKITKDSEEYFWKMENIQIVDRIKSYESVMGKLKNKNIDTHDEELDKNETIKIHVEDLVGIRISTAHKQDMERVVEMITHNKFWLVAEIVGYTDDNSESEDWKKWGIKNIQAKMGGYSGIHFILGVAEGKRSFAKAEVQIRTHFQNAWQQMEHPLYKMRDNLPEVMIGMRNGLSKQIEGIITNHDNVTKFALGELKEKGIRNIPHELISWGEVCGKPKEMVGKVIGTLEFKDDLFIFVTDTRSVLLLHDHKILDEELGEDWKDEIKRVPFSLLSNHYNFTPSTVERIKSEHRVLWEKFVESMKI